MQILAMSKMTGNIKVEVVYGTTSQQIQWEGDVPVNSTIRQAILISGILSQHPEISLAKQKVGIFGKIKSMDSIVQEGDRVEIYRPLKIDPNKLRLSKVRL